MVSAVLTAAICCFARVFGERAQLIARPDGDRRLHEKDTPLIGGLAVLVPAFVVSLIYMTFYKHEFFMQVAIIASAFMLIIGVLDDRLGISPVWRLVALTFISFVVFSVEPMFVLYSFHFWILHVNWIVQLAPIAAPITALMIVGFVNASNMADGMNGQLLGSILIWSALIMRHLGFDAALPFVALICSTAVALVFNLRSKLFSGSAGAYAASLFIALGAIAAYRQSYPILYAQTPLFWFWLPVLDCLRLFVTRIAHGKSPFLGDRSHFHHMLLDVMRTRYALPIYLVLLGLPGAVAETGHGDIGQNLAKIALLVCLAIYGAIVIWRTVARKQAIASVQGARSVPVFSVINTSIQSDTTINPAE